MDPPTPADPEPQDELRLIELGHLTSAVCHSLINAFSTIVSNAEMIQFASHRDDSADPSASPARRIIQTSLEAAEIARRLIDFARPRLAIGTRQVDLVALLREVAARHRQTSAAILWTDALVTVPRIKGDPRQLERMLDFLITNAREALEPEGGTITLTSGTDERGRPYVEIQDDGPGMAPAVLECALEPFFSTKPESAGIGLNLAKSIWLKHRGSLALDSAPSRGTSARLHIERAMLEDEQPAS